MNLNRSPSITRRAFLAGMVAGSFIMNSACRQRGSSKSANEGRLTARPHAGVKTLADGQTKLGLDSERDALLYIPNNVGQSPVPLLVLLHGATQSAEDMWYLGSAPDEARVAVLAPSSRATTWDAVSGSFGEDVEFIDQALQRVFETAAIDTGKISVGGFSDGASYALALGLINGDLFRGVVAFSPGFFVDNIPHGKRPRFFISHGTKDHILPINRCGRRIATDLKARGYEVTFREFAGDHEIPADIALEGLSWVANG